MRGKSGKERVNKVVRKVVLQQALLLLTIILASLFILYMVIGLDGLMDYAEIIKGNLITGVDKLIIAAVAAFDGIIWFIFYIIDKVKELLD